MLKKSFLILLLLTTMLTVKAQINYEYFFTVGKYKLFEDEYVDAIKYLNTAIFVRNDLYEAYFFRGVAKYSLSDYSGAEEDFNRALEIHPLYKWALHYRAITRNNLGKFEEALEDFDVAMRINVLDPDIHINRGITYMRLKDYKGAQMDFDEAIRLDPKNDNAFVNRCVLKALKKEYDEAIIDCNHAIALNNFSFDAFLKRGLIKYEQESYEEALSDYEYALRIDDNNPLVYFHIALSQLKLNDTMGALENYNNVLALDPHNALTYYNRAILYRNLGEDLKALNDLNRTLTYNPQNLYTLFQRGQTYLTLKQYKKALADFDQAIDIYPDFGIAWLQRAEVKSKMGMAYEAHQDYMKGQEILNNASTDKNRDKLVAFADSVNLEKIIEFEADFHAEEIESKRVQYTNVYVELLPLFSLRYYLNDTEYIDHIRNSYTDKILSVFNNENTLSLRFAFSDLADSVSADKVLSHIENADSLRFSSPNDPMIQFFLAIINSRINNYNTALKSYNEVLKDDPNFIYSYFNRGAVLAKLQDLEWEHQHKSFITIEDNNVETTNQMVFSRDFGAAINDYTTVIEQYPQFAVAYFNRGTLYAREEEFEKAIADFNKAIKLWPAFKEAYFNRALVKIYIGDEDACDDLSKAGELGIINSYNIIKRYCK